MLNNIERERIRAAGRPKGEEHYEMTENPLLSVTVEQLRERWPEHFHSDATLSQRVFYHQPRDHVECAGYIVPRISRGGAD